MYIKYLAMAVLAHSKALQIESICCRHYYSCYYDGRLGGRGQLKGKWVKQTSA